ncbi:Uncharacterised protein [Mycobacteroides abscessus subsp. abscessus]|nr:Uncharacterised protein [Mycobacteroides abscessus subsp. abscessus]
MAATRARSAAAVARVPCIGRPSGPTPPVERGNSSYHAPYSARVRSTQMPYWVPRVSRSRSGNSSSSPSASTDSAC